MANETEHGAYSKTMERIAIERAKATYFQRGGAIGFYLPGMAWNQPIAARNGQFPVDVASYLAPLKARREEKARRMRRLHDERMARAAEFQAEGA